MQRPTLAIFKASPSAILLPLIATIPPSYLIPEIKITLSSGVALAIILSFFITLMNFYLSVNIMSYICFSSFHIFSYFPILLLNS